MLSSPGRTSIDIDKLAVLQCLRTRMAETLARLTAAQASAQSGAVHKENKQEHAKDMRSTEASYLSRGLAERAEALADAVAVLNVFTPRSRTTGQAAQLGDLVGLVDEEGEETIYFLAPVGGGEKLVLASAAVLVVTPRSPLGQALLGSRPGDEVSVERPAGRRELAIAWVA